MTVWDAWNTFTVDDDKVSIRFWDNLHYCYVYLDVIPNYDWHKYEDNEIESLTYEPLEDKLTLTLKGKKESLTENFQVNQ